MGGPIPCLFSGSFYRLVREGLGLLSEQQSPYRLGSPRVRGPCLSFFRTMVGFAVFIQSVARPHHIGLRTSIEVVARPHHLYIFKRIDSWSGHVPLFLSRATARIVGFLPFDHRCRLSSFSPKDISIYYQLGWYCQDIYSILY